jgi:hypothetical protein
LKAYETQLRKRWDQGNFWWELRECDYYDKFAGPKIIFPDMATKSRFALDREGYFSLNTTYFIAGDDCYLLGLLNSKLGQFCFKQICAGLESRGTTYLRFFGQYLDRFPVREIDSLEPAGKSSHDRMVKLVESMLALHKQLPSANSEGQRGAIHRQIEATDAEIDRMVYDLYGLTADEIGIVAEGNP